MTVRKAAIANTPEYNPVVSCHSTQPFMLRVAKFVTSKITIVGRVYPVLITERPCGPFQFLPIKAGA